MFRTDEIALAFLIWRSRIDVPVTDWRGATGLEHRFAEHLSGRATRQHSGDFRAAVEIFKNALPSFADWYAGVLEPFENRLVFEAGEPKIRSGSLADWRRTTAKVDGDALVTLALARRLDPRTSARQVVGTLANWGYFLPACDDGVERIVSAGLADTHIHFEASDPMPLLWLRLSAGLVEARQLRFYSDREIERLRIDPVAFERRANEREWLEKAAEQRIDLVAALNLPPPDASGASLAEERELLLTAWRAALDPNPSSSVVAAYDRYLFGKNLFLRRHQQGALLGPGLDRFRDFLDRGETLGEKRLKKVRTTARRERFARMLSLATQPASVRMLELRVAPQRSLRGWRDLFRLWRDRFATNPGSATGGIPVRFVVHFIRAPDPKTSPSCQMHFGNLRATLDRQSAILHLFRTTMPELAKYVVGIDVANHERGCPPELFAPYLALLRGQGRLAGDLDCEALQCWGRLEPRQANEGSLSLPRLGITYHAGEDFLHPVDGMRAMSGLIDNLLEPGDRIGHGLAVGVDVARFQNARGRPPMPRGVLLDDLIWLRKQTSRFGAWVDALRVDGDHAIDDLARQIYGTEQAPSVLERMLDARFEMPHCGSAAATPREPELSLVRAEAFDEKVIAARRAHSDPRHVELLHGMVGLMPEVQSRLIFAIREAGVVVEASPTSNLVTGAVDDLSQHPFFRYFEVLGGQSIVSINTDDPGVFGTRLDVEYGIMFEAARSRGYDRVKALNALEAARRTAWEHAFGRRLEDCQVSGALPEP